MFWFVGGPGFPACLARPDAELFSDQFTVYLIDPHGSGGSTPPRDASEYDHIGHARFYDEVRRALGLKQVTIAGVSFGGTVALAYGALFPETTVRCIAMGPLALGPAADDADASAEMDEMLSRHAEADWYETARSALDGYGEQVVAASEASQLTGMLRTSFPLYFAHPDRPDVRRLIQWAQQEWRTDLAAQQAIPGGRSQGIDLRALLATMVRPALIICGALDPVGGPAHARRIVEAVPGADLVTVPDCGHFPSWEAPEQFKAIVMRWLEMH